MTTLTIIRGVPGTGKSTLAKAIANDYQYIPIVHLEADMWMSRNGVYKYDPKELDNAHNWCKTSAGLFLVNGVSVIVSNTFTRYFEFDPYIEIANKLKVPYKVIRMTKEYGSVHNVSESQMEKMRQRFEDYHNETLIT